MASHRTQRTTEDIRRELADIMRSIKDPRVTGLLSIVKVDLSGDYSYCKVLISSMEGLEAAKKAVEGLNSAAGYVRREIGLRIRMRRSPEFQFIADNGIEYSASINKMLGDIL
ncbi:30S ribosome-binding factor RbfA [Oscillospiraceae bacterium MB08-C2-2]|nr:30S ribosome-binding factor RbfA [Oscillospiraceae bacterium MB08-C2-2]